MTPRKLEQTAGRTLSMMAGSLTGYIFAMLASQALVRMPIFGGALYMCARLAAVLFTDYVGAPRRALPLTARRWTTVLLGALLALNTLVLLLYPIRMDHPLVWLIFAQTLAMMIGEGAGRRLNRLSVRRSMAEGRYRLLTALAHLIPALALALVYFCTLPAETAWPLLGGYALYASAALYSQVKTRDGWQVMSQAESDAGLAQMAETMRRTNAFSTYERLSTLILAAMVMTMVTMYAYFAITAQQVLIYMVLATLCMLVFREAAELILRRRSRRRPPDPTNLMLVGLFLWLYGLGLFSRMLRAGTVHSSNLYVCLGLCAAGGTVCITCLERMEQVMASVARFAAGDDGTRYVRLRAVGFQNATLLGETLALAALTAMCLVSGNDLPRDAAQIAASFQPLMVVPVLLTVLGALLSALRFPLSSRYMDKLSRFLRLQEQGGDNPALKKQLEQVVVARHRQPFGTRLIMALLRPFYRHALKDADRIAEDVNNPIVFLCNHGEFYGPLVCMLYMPVPLRPWVISDIVIDKREVAEYVYRYTISQQKWLPKPLQWPIARLIGPISVWLMGQVESIPVFRNKPRELMTTFRRSVEAMETGDNLLIFPENPDADREHPGYEREGLGELFSGFAMLAPIYFNRTGKRCRFLPVYAHKGARTISFGTEVVYDPDNAPQDERDRLVTEISAQMRALADREEALYQQKKRGAAKPPAQTL